MAAANAIADRRATPTKLDPLKVEQTRALEGTLARGEIAQRFGVNPTTVGQVLRGVVWRKAVAA